MDEHEARRGRPPVCVTDGKAHIQKFLREMLGAYGFTIYECVEIGELSAALDARPQDLVVLVLTARGIVAAEMLRLFAAHDFEGKILPVATRDSPVVRAIQELAEELGIALLPPLLMPFGKERLHDSLSVPLAETSGPLVDMGEAVRGGWLELWYQPKIDTQGSLCAAPRPCCAFATRCGGIVPTAYFIADDGDPRSGPISEVVMNRAVADWHHFFMKQGPIELAVNLPMTFLQDPESIKGLHLKLPDHAAFQGLMIESNGTDIVRNLTLAKDVAHELRDHKVAISSSRCRGSASSPSSKSRSTASS